MSGQTVGYIRVSTIDQNESRQLDGKKLKRKFIDKASGKDTNRPQLKELIAFVREGDTVLVHSMDRLARNLGDLKAIVRELTDKKVIVTFVKDSLTFTDEGSAMSDMMLNVMGAFAEFERSLIKERQREGIAIAKKNNVYKGRKQAMTDNQIKEIQKKALASKNKVELAKELGISRQTLYTYIAKKFES